ncbi:hypothetical protein Ddc_13975 [Ditylenchus destructor]|nr:hypothetical protein Ddc_13975 [Ditylenchus destructor]
MNFFLPRFLLNLWPSPTHKPAASAPVVPRECDPRYDWQTHGKNPAFPGFRLLIFDPLVLNPESVSTHSRHQGSRRSNKGSNSGSRAPFHSSEVSFAFPHQDLSFDTLLARNGDRLPEVRVDARSKPIPDSESAGWKIRRLATFPQWILP